MKKLSKFLILSIFILTLFLSGCNKTNNADDEPLELTSNPLFYKISKGDSDVNIYLLGSIHAADDTAYPLNDIITKAFNKSDYLAVEVDIVALEKDLNRSIALAQKLLYTDGTTIKDYLNSELYNEMIEILKEKKLYNKIYDNYKPAFFESLFENAIIMDANLDARKGIDNYFLNLAKDNNKEILEIETAEFQYDLLLNNPLDLDELTISSYVFDYDSNVLELKELYDAWKNGDITKLEKSLEIVASEEMTEEEINLLEQYNQSLITDRNYGMVEKLDEYFNENKNVFCVVGVGHVIGDKGIVELMRKKGYTVDLVKWKE